MRIADRAVCEDKLEKLSITRCVSALLQSGDECETEGGRIKEGDTARETR